MRNSLFLLVFMFLAQAFGQELVPMVAVNDLVADGVQESEARILTDRLRVEMIGTKAVRVMERSQMDAILAEQGFQQSGACNSEQCQVQMGQLLAVDRLVVGQVGKFGEMYTVSARIINVGSGEVMVTAAVDHEGRLEGLLKDRMRELAQKLAGVPVTTVAQPEAKAEVKPAPKASIDPQVSAPPATKSRWPMYVLRGVLFAGAVSGGIAGYLLDQDAEEMANDYSPKNHSQARQYQEDISSAESSRNIAFIVGGVLAAGGVISFAF